MSISGNEVPLALSVFLKGLGMSLIAVKSLKYHEYPEEEKPLLRMAGIVGYDDKTWFAVVQALDPSDGVTKLFNVVCDAKSGECQMLHLL